MRLLWGMMQELFAVVGCGLFVCSLIDMPVGGLFVDLHLLQPSELCTQNNSLDA